MYIKVQKKRFNQLWIGLLGGILLPFAALAAFYFSRYYPYKTILEFMQQMFSYNLFTKILSLCAIPNLLLFFIFIWASRYNPAKGVILATFLMVIAVIIIQSAS